MLADTPLVKNLSNPDYMSILLDGKSNLEERFAEIEMNGGAYDTKLVIGTENILPGFRSLANLPELPKLIAQLFNMDQMVLSQSN